MSDMNQTNGGYNIPQRRGYDNYEDIDRNYRQQAGDLGRMGASTTPIIGGSRSVNNMSYSREDEALQLLQQLAAEQSELLEQLHGVDKSTSQPTAVVRPSEQFLTIALNGEQFESQKVDEQC